MTASVATTDKRAVVRRSALWVDDETIEADEGGSGNVRETKKRGGRGLRLRCSVSCNDPDWRGVADAKSPTEENGG